MLSKGKLIIFSAPSGAGKTTMVKALFDRVPGLEFSVSATTRQPRTGEQDGREYFFLSEEQFLRHIQAGDFVEYEEVYPGTSYGTLKREVDSRIHAGKHVVFDIDVMGGLKVKRQYAELALALFIMPPDLGELEMRLRRRGTESESSLLKRLDKAKWEISYAHQFDQIIINDNLNRAVDEMLHRVKSFIADG
jgi:guanylate kinase